ncbi:MAG: 30S ribosomal protein S7 [Flavobacteriales bacterium]|nr:30S ribosomal protein S7 [Flavobacteriales bacterium]MCB9191484.1 30S ribosomal protein S7 [Flavobacteriales bacterium]MCB9203890.1 30S ribosomal protein S7 [Flavobacteriales bacterium]
MRKSIPKKRELVPDPKFKDTLVTRFVNSLMVDGKKSVALKVFYDAIEIVDQKSGDEESGLEVWKKALNNIMPPVEVKSRRVGGSTFQIPVEVRPKRKLALGIKWMIDYSKKRNDKSMSRKLAAEILAAAKEEGAAFKKKEDTLRMAEANKAFSHFKF